MGSSGPLPQRVIPRRESPRLSHGGSHQKTRIRYGYRVPDSGSHGGTGGRGYNGVLGSPPTKGYPTEGVTTVIPRRESPKITEGGRRGGGGDTVSVCQADRLGSRGQNVETSISGSCWCGGHEAQRTSRQRPPTIVAGAERRQSLRRLHVAHPVLDHGVGCLAVAGMVGRRRAGGAPTPALEAH